MPSLLCPRNIFPGGLSRYKDLQEPLQSSCVLLSGSPRSDCWAGWPWERLQQGSVLPALSPPSHPDPASLVLVPAFLFHLPGPARHRVLASFSLQAPLPFFLELACPGVLIWNLWSLYLLACPQLLHCLGPSACPPYSGDIPDSLATTQTILYSAPPNSSQSLHEPPTLTTLHYCFLDTRRALLPPHSCFLLLEHPLY